VARHSETEEEFVIYRCLCGDFSPWVWPLVVFTAAVIADGREVAVLFLVRRWGGSVVWAVEGINFPS
jgi:hypothetical protein